MEKICFLRDLDILIKDIAEILESDEAKKAIELLIDEQENNIQKEVKRKTEQLEKIKSIRSTLIWIPFFAALAVFIVCAVFLLDCWYKQIEYICPECHTRFRPKKMEAFLGNHTPKMRKLTCPSCKRKIWSLEVYTREVDV